MDELKILYDAMSKASRHDVVLEVILTAMNEIKSNSSLTIEEALKLGLDKHINKK